MHEVQGLVDALASSLGRPVGVDDRRFRAVAYSSHHDGVDPVRLASILQREAPGEVTSWLLSLGIADARDWVRVPATARFGMAARVCVPIRFDGTLLGYLWLIDEPPLDDAQLRRATDCAEELAAALFRERRLEDSERERERELVARLLEGSPEEAAAAAAALHAGGLLAPAARSAVVAVEAVHPDGLAAPDPVRVHLAAAAEELRRALPPHHLLARVAGAEVAAVVALGAGAEAGACAAALLRRAEAELAECPGWSAVAGAGAPRAAAAELGASHAEARRAIGLGRRVPGLGPLVDWDAVGAWRTVATLAEQADAGTLVPASLRRLLASPDADTLVPTLESYLEHAGDARAAAAELFVHRSSLYHRLRRIEEVAEVELASGDARLELHLGLRLWRLAGGGATAVGSAAPDTGHPSHRGGSHAA